MIWDYMVSSPRHWIRICHCRPHICKQKCTILTPLSCLRDITDRLSGALPPPVWAPSKCLTHCILPYCSVLVKAVWITLYMLCDCVHAVWLCHSCVPQRGRPGRPGRKLTARWRFWLHTLILIYQSLVKHTSCSGALTCLQMVCMVHVQSRM